MSKEGEKSPFVGKVTLKGLSSGESSGVAWVQMEGLPEAWEEATEGEKFAKRFAGIKGSEGGDEVASRGKKVLDRVNLECNMCPANRNIKLFYRMGGQWWCHGLGRTGEAVVTGFAKLTAAEWRTKMQEGETNCGPYLRLEGEAPESIKLPEDQRSRWSKLFG
jgi:hypothetical protein